MVILGMAVCGAFSAFADEEGNVELVKADTAFPDIGYSDAQGQPHKLKDDLGKLTLVHFWATWCAPCVEELPLIDAVQRNYGAQGLKIIDISEDGNHKMAEVEAFFIQHSITSMAAYIDSDNEAFRSVHGRGLPTTYFISHDGRKIAVAEGPVNWQSPSVKQFIEQQLKVK